jgi:hypothetical protein
MPHYYVDLDNNKLITGSASTQIAATPSLYQGDKPTLELELITRTTGVMTQYTSAASAVNVRIGALGSSSVASALTLSVITLSATGTATVGITSPVTATGLATMLGSITATATAGINTTVTGSITANFSQVQMPTVIPVLAYDKIAKLEVPTCGKNFSEIPSVLVSEPDYFYSYSNGTDASSGSATLIYTAPTTGWPEVSRIVVYYQAGSGGATLQLNTTGQFLANLTVVSGASGQWVIDDQSIFYGPLYIQSIGSGSKWSSVLEYRNPSESAIVSGQVSSGNLTLVVQNEGQNYRTKPDVFVIPSPSDYSLGVVKTATSATITQRTVVVTSSAHGLTTGSLIYVENAAVSSVASFSGEFNLQGIWPIVSVTTDSISFRQAKWASSTTKSFSVSTASFSIYPVTLNRVIASASVSCAGSGYSAGSAIPFSISSDSCGGLAGAGSVSVSNAGQLAGITVTCAGSGFTTTSTVVSLTSYKSISSLTVTCAGSGYWTAVPAVIVDSINYVATAPGAMPAVVSAGLNGDGTISLSLVSAGYGYTSTPSITIASPNSGDGIRIISVATLGVGYSDGTFACTVSAAPTGGTTAVVNFVKSGTSQSFSIVNPGRGYTSAPGVVVTKPNLGGQVSAFTVTCKGAGYLVAPAITFTGGGGSGAVAEATIDNGSIATISITTGGTGYTSAPAITIDSPPSSVYYKKQIDLSTASVTSILSGNTSASAYLQIEEKSGTDTSVLAQVPITIQARIS